MPFSLLRVIIFDSGKWGAGVTRHLKQAVVTVMLSQNQRRQTPRSN
ncbi:MAG TPA: hypothetical protein PLU30_14540 [Verrucomicrobiae bacterium]|nr:hypothetical protein [Verrucomicrobiae bacterium]